MHLIEVDLWAALGDVNTGWWAPVKSAGIWRHGERQVLDEVTAVLVGYCWIIRMFRIDGGLIADQERPMILLGVLYLERDLGTFCPSPQSTIYAQAGQAGRTIGPSTLYSATSPFFTPGLAGKR